MSIAVLPTLEAYTAWQVVTTGHAGALATLGVWINEWDWLPLLVLGIVIVPLLFPDGHLPSRRWRWLVGVVLLGLVLVSIPSMLTPTLTGQDIDYTVANPIGVTGIGWAQAVGNIAFLVLSIIPGVFGTIASLVVRFRRSPGVERQQLKWLFLAVGMTPLIAVSGVPVIGAVLFGLTLAAVPAAIGIAILRYRLYDIDRIVSRTLAYAIVVAVLVGVYAAGVLGLGAVARAVTGESGDLVVAVSTLLVAAVFRPVASRVRRVVDRRFNRASVDAVLAAEAFRQRLRDEVDLDTVLTDLGATVQRTLAPASVAITTVALDRDAP